VSTLTLDLGTKTGWAVGAFGRQTESGTREFRTTRFDGGGVRLLHFRSWLFDLYKAYTFRAVYYEEVRRHAGVDAAHAYGGFMGTLCAWCEDTADPRKPVAIPYQGIPVGTIKRAATGKGNANKEAMIAAMVARGYAPADDNEADALALLHYVLNTT
jgi:Holliday junction resolvasome RuvABC endonuclease subunit